jgi:hypothetical protein
MFVHIVCSAGFVLAMKIEQDLLSHDVARQENC